MYPGYNIRSRNMYYGTMRHFVRFSVPSSMAGLPCSSVGHNAAYALPGRVGDHPSKAMRFGILHVEAHTEIPFYLISKSFTVLSHIVTTSSEHASSR
ncbi:hypothetical protein ACQQ2Q_18895 [Agrobacterium sp. ES01]|uniref:hypothetical protein n=1 Tax=Agrobacterium sp. ES01 TaxID=3420714 RepID=UPI003D0C6BA2